MLIARVSSIIGLAACIALTIPGHALAQQAPGVLRRPQASQLLLPPDAAVTKRALDWLRRLELGDIDRSQLDSTLNAKLTPQSIGLMQTELGPFGQPSAIQLVASRKMNGNDAYMYVLSFRAARLQEVMIINPAGKIAGLVFTPVAR